MPKQKGYADCTVTKGFGYSVSICLNNGKIIDQYEAGDCAIDSQVFGTGQLNSETLATYAKQTAREMLDENNIKGKVFVSFEDSIDEKIV